MQEIKAFWDFDTKSKHDFYDFSDEGSPFWKHFLRKHRTVMMFLWTLSRSFLIFIFAQIKTLKTTIIFFIQSALINFCLTFALTSLHFPGELDYVRHVEQEKIRFGPIRTHKSLISNYINYMYMFNWYCSNG